MKRETRFGLIFGILLLIVGGFIGLITGMNLGGNYFTSFQLGTWTGYEATGMIGLMVGGLVGALGGWLIGRRMGLRKI